MLSGCRTQTKTEDSRPVRLWLRTYPYSADPLEYDAFAHHIAFTSVYAGLVTHYRVGEYVGQLAESWEASGDFKEWKFVFRENMTFENGEPIRPRHLVDSWLRLARILKARGSETGFFEKLLGYRSLTATSGTISGITCDDSGITLRFTEPMPKLLNTLAFGLYVVVHPSCYDQTTGRWLNPRKTVASGAYRVQKWNAGQLVLDLRKEHPAALRHPRPLVRADMRWDRNGRDHSDIVSGSNLEDFSSKGLIYHGGPESGIAFLRCLSWAKKSSPLANASFRRALRDLFYEELEKASFRPIRSFFPLAIKGVREATQAADAATNVAPLAGKVRIKYRPYGPENSYLAEPVRRAIVGAAKRAGITLDFVETSAEAVYAELDPTLPRYKNDVVGMRTGILIDDPDGDIRFMFRSKEGIMLPDPSRKAAAALSRKKIDVQRVNEILWDDAIIWPLTHLSVGLWATPRIDFSMLNLVLPPTSLQFIGWAR